MATVSNRTHYAISIVSKEYGFSQIIAEGATEDGLPDDAVRDWAERGTDHGGKIVIRYDDKRKGK